MDNIKHKPATPLTPVQQFYSTHNPGDAIRLAMADHAAHCDPMMPQGDFMRALQKALDRTEAYPRLVADAHDALSSLRMIRNRLNLDVDAIRSIVEADIERREAILRELGESE